MKRIVIFVYGVVSYAIFFGTFVYASAFVGNFVVSRTIDAPGAVSLTEALIVNALLLGAFAVQHSVMARPWFKRWWTRFVPEPAERSTYVLFSCLAFIALFWQWRPMGGVVWNVEDPAGRAVMYGLFAAGWLTVLVTSFFINHFDLFGLRQVYLHLRGKKYAPLGFMTPGPYKHIRHPLYVGWALAFWATPTMSAAHLFFAAITTAYMLVAIVFEERDLVGVHGRAYAEYRERTPMFLPRISRRGGAPASAELAGAQGGAGGR